MVPNTKHAALLTIQEVASVANVSESTVKRWIASGELPKIKLGRRKPNRVRDNRPVRLRVKDVAKLIGATLEDIQTALAGTTGASK